MQVQVKAEYIAIVFSYCSLTSMSPVGNHSLALQSRSAEKITYAHETLLKKKIIITRRTVIHWIFWKLKKPLCLLRRLLLSQREVQEQQTPRTWQVRTSDKNLIQKHSLSIKAPEV